VGDWKEDLPHGKGTLTRAGGSKYTAACLETANLKGRECFSVRTVKKQLSTCNACCPLANMHSDMVLEKDDPVNNHIILLNDLLWQLTKEKLDE